MTRRVPFNLRTLLLSTAILLLTACATRGAESLAPTAYGPLPSPKPAFTGLALPATMAPPSKTPTTSSTVNTPSWSSTPGPSVDDPGIDDGPRPKELEWE